MLLTPIYRLTIVLLVMGIFLFLSLNPLQESQYGKKSDEGYYYKYATLVVHQGRSAFHDLILWYASSAKVRLHPAPVRVGYILLSAFLFKLYKFNHFMILGFVSLISFLLFLYVCFYYVRKYFDLDTSLLTLLFLASSPLMLGLSRRALVDSPANLLWALTLWLFLDVLYKPNRLSYVCFLIALIMAVTFKEISIILIPFFVIVGLLEKRNGSAVKISQICGIVVYPLTFVFFFYGWLYGGLDVLKTAVMAIAKTHFSSSYPSFYAVNYCSGPWFRYLLDFLLLVPVELLLFVGYVGYLLTQRSSLDFKRIYFLSYFIYVYGILSSLSHSKVVRFAVNLEMVMALFAVLMLVEIFRGMGEKIRRLCLIYSCLGIFTMNFFSFMDLFFKTLLLDPISYYLLVFRHFMTWVS